MERRPVEASTRDHLRLVSTVTWLLLAALLSSCEPSKAAPLAEATEAARAVKKIEIEYRHSGWGSIDENYLIKPYGDDFIIVPDTARQRGHGGQAIVPTVKAIPLAQVQQLLEAWNAPVMPRAQGLGAVAATVSSQPLTEAFEKKSADWNLACDKQARSYKQQLASDSITYRLLDGYYGKFWTDDYPIIEVRIHRSTKTVATIRSNAQQDLMLPWKRNGMETWDPNMSHAVVTLLPEASHARQRLLGKSLVTDIAGDAVYDLQRLCRGGGGDVG